MPLQGYWWAGRDNAILSEPISSYTNCLKTRTLSLRAAVPPPHLHWRAVPVWPRRALSGVGCTSVGWRHPISQKEQKSCSLGRCVGRRRHVSFITVYSNHSIPYFRDIFL